MMKTQQEVFRYRIQRKSVFYNNNNTENIFWAFNLIESSLYIVNQLPAHVDLSGWL